MIKSILILSAILLCFADGNYAQDKIDFHSPDNIRLFADYLFCQNDYLRASGEYTAYLASSYNDTVEFKSGLSLQFIRNYDDALSRFNSVSPGSSFYTAARQEYARTLFLQNSFRSLHDYFLSSDPSGNSYPFLRRLDCLSYFYTNVTLPPENDFVSPFPDEQKNYLKKFYVWKSDPPYKSPLLAGIFSAVVPGLGKVYTQNYTDGLFAAILTGLFGYIAYTDFKAGHDVRGWLFTGVSAFFYTGGIYGSAASAQIYNAKIRFDFESELQSFLDMFGYNRGDYNFCK